jgi:cytochrome c556
MLRPTLANDSQTGWLLSIALVFVLLAGPALADGHAKGVDPNIKYRQSLMEIIGTNMGAIGDIMKNQLDLPGAIANHAGQMAEAAALIGPAFKKDISKGPTDAKPEIWKDWAKFEKAVADYESAAQGLASAAAGSDPAAVGAAMKTLGKSCSGCHKPFRKPKEESFKRSGGGH